jgi:hypothetical protein
MKVTPSHLRSFAAVILNVVIKSKLAWHLEKAFDELLRMRAVANWNM